MTSKLSCSSRMVKYLMFGFNLLFVITGIIIIAVGTAVKTVYTDYAEFLDNKYFSLPNMLIATGAFIFIVSFFGCCGALKESWIMLGIFSIFLCIIFIFEFASGIAGYVLRDKTEAFLEERLRQNLDTYNVTHGVWDLIQETFQCCGVDSYEDWKNKLNTTYALPMSCCPRQSGIVGAYYCNSFPAPTTSTAPPVTETPTPLTTTPPITIPPTTILTTETPTASTDETVQNGTETKRRRRDADIAVRADEATTEAPTSPASTTDPFHKGCKQQFGDYIRKHAVQIGGCALGLAILQILGIIFSCHLVRQMKNGYYST